MNMFHSRQVSSLKIGIERQRQRANGDLDCAKTYCVTCTIQSESLVLLVDGLLPSYISPRPHLNLCECQRKELCRRS
jgi:hypothetical protein